MKWVGRELTYPFLIVQPHPSNSWRWISWTGERIRDEEQRTRQPINNELTDEFLPLPFLPVSWELRIVDQLLRAGPNPNSKEKGWWLHLQTRSISWRCHHPVDSSLDESFLPRPLALELGLPRKWLGVNKSRDQGRVIGQMATGPFFICPTASHLLSVGSSFLNLESPKGKES